MARLSFVRPEELDDPELSEIFAEAFRHGAPPPDLYAIRAHSPEILKAWDRLFSLCLKQSRVGQAIMELCRLHVVALLECHY